MTGRFRYPNIGGGSPSEQLSELKRFVWNLIDELNHMEEMKTESSPVEQILQQVNSVDAIKTTLIKNSAWVGTESPYSQKLGIGTIPANSRVDIFPSKQVIGELFDNGTVLTTENSNGTVTVYAIGRKPLNDISAQVVISKTKSGG